MHIAHTRTHTIHTTQLIVLCDRPDNSDVIVKDDFVLAMTSFERGLANAMGSR